MHFEHERALGYASFGPKVVYSARTIENTLEERVVKFTRRHNGQAHILLFGHGYASKLLFDGLKHTTFPRPAENYMIVMSYVQDSPECPSRGEGYLELRAVLGILHETRLVFGDLRYPNIIVSTIRFKQKPVMPVDFDWRGKDGMDFYPWDINMGNS